MKFPPFARSLSVCAAAFGVVYAVPARAQFTSVSGKRLSPDLLQTLGVGSRSIAMGNAFSAIADDASATFWNPGRLAQLNNREFMIEFRPVLNTNFNPSFHTLTSGGVTVNDPTKPPPTFDTGNHPGKPQLGFASVVTRLSARESIGLSYTLGGYFSRESVGHSEDINSDDPAGNIDTTVDEKHQTLVRNSFITFAYGNRIPIKVGGTKTKPRRAFLGAGIGIFFVNQDFSQTDKNRTTSVQNGTTIADSRTGPTTVSERGHGVGVNVGLAFDPPGKWHYGLSYRSMTNLSGLSDTVGKAFNTEIPGRLSLGLAYETGTHAGLLLVSLEGQSFSAANRGVTATGGSEIDRRRAVTDIHFGIEFTPKHIFFDSSKKPQYRMPLRFGFHTNANAAPNYTYYDNIISVGFALQRLSRARPRVDPATGLSTSVPGVAFTLEPTIEILTSNGATQFTLTSRLRF